MLANIGNYPYPSELEELRTSDLNTVSKNFEEKTVFCHEKFRHVQFWNSVIFEQEEWHSAPGSRHDSLVLGLP